MNHTCRLLLPVLAYVFVGSLPAYELHTHAAITKEAYERSILSDPVILDDMGLSAVPGTLGLDYYDIRNGIARTRVETPFELEIIRKVGADELTLQGWLMRGAIREDDIPLPFGDNPQDLSPPDLPFYRVFNHFYDPVYNRPLTVPSAFQGWVTALNEGAVQTAVDWATGSVNSFGALNTPNTGRRNHFTLVDAREAMYRAATGRDLAGNTDIGPNGAPATKEVRDAYWATVFRSLGDVVHLVQDMGQPQHTRNEAHSPLNAFFQGDHITVFEELTEQRAGGKKFTCFDGNEPSGIPSLLFTNYSVPSFSNYSEVFSTTPGGNVAQGRGLADYSNRGFFTAGKNFGNTEYASPSSNLANYSQQPVTDPNPCLATGRQAELLRGTVPDLVGSTSTGVALTARGLWDVPGYFIPREEAKYSMNETVYYENADLLVTRAASYSAGMINYFFRGKIDLVKDPQNSAQYIIRNLGTEEMEGTFALYYDGTDGIRYPVLGASWQLILSPGEDSVPVSFPAPTDPVPANADYYLIFNGRMGNELPSANSVGAVVVKLISEYWEPWGDNLTENHLWEEYTDPSQASVPPISPVDGILSLDTRLIVERGAAFCAAYNCQSRARRAIVLCDVVECPWVNEEIDVREGYLRIRLKVDSNYGNIPSPACDEQGWITLTAENYVYQLAVQIFHQPGSQNGSLIIEDSGEADYVIINNNGQYHDYMVPVHIGSNALVYLDAWAEDNRIKRNFGNYICHDAYFVLDIDYIDFTSTL